MAIDLQRNTSTKRNFYFFDTCSSLLYHELHNLLVRPENFQLYTILQSAGIASVLKIIAVKFCARGKTGIQLKIFISK